MENIPAAIGNLELRTFAPGEVLIQEKSTGHRLFFLIHGTVEVTKEGTPIARVREPGAMFGEMSVLLETSHTATVIATTEVECRTTDDPLGFLKANPDVMLYVGRILARRLESLNRYLLDVKAQFRDMEGHLGMVDQVLDALMNRHPRQIPIPPDPGS